MKQRVTALRHAALLVHQGLIDEQTLSLARRLVVPLAVIMRRAKYRVLPPAK